MVLFVQLLDEVVEYQAVEEEYRALVVRESRRDWIRCFECMPEAVTADHFMPCAKFREGFVLEDLAVAELPVSKWEGGDHHKPDEFQHFSDERVIVLRWLSVKVTDCDMVGDVAAQHGN